MVLVLDQERLNVEFDAVKKRGDLPDFVKILSLPKSGGVVCKSSDMRTQTKNLRIHEYFYGTTKSILYPHSIEIGFNEVSIFKIGAPQLPDSLLPMGMKAEDNYTKIFKIAPCKCLFACKMLYITKVIQRIYSLLLGRKYSIFLLFFNKFSKFFLAAK